MNRTRWERLSPLLDELLDLDAAARARRLQDLRHKDPSVAAELEAMLAPVTDGEHRGFLEGAITLPRPSLAGRRIGAYTIERELGQGGMGSVWLARRTDGRYEGSVAVKLLNMGLAASGGAERFAREGSILARLAHPHIARLIDAGVTDDTGQPYLVLEYIEGLPIDRHCEAKALGIEARLRLFLDVLGAIAHAHNRLILHRDIKPSNILVTEAGEVKLLDFGIAKLLDDAAAPAQASELTRQAGSAFTPLFAAPEQVRGGDVTTATDVYALGVLLYVLLGGMHPTAAATSTAVDQMRSVVETEPKRLSDAVARDRDGDPAAKRLARQLRGDLDNIVAKALKKSPAERYANASQLADDLQRHLAHEPVAARRDALSYRVAKFVRRHRLGVAAGSTVALALAGGIGVALWQANEARQQRVQAEGLIEFMLGDLRKKLQPVGRLDVLDAVGERTLAYYAAQDAGSLDADSLGRRARALHLIGEIHEKRGRLDDALAAFSKAADTTAQLLSRTPNEGQRIFDHAQSVYWVGYIAWRRGQTERAEASFQEYLTLAQRLTALETNNVDWNLELAYANQNLGVVYLDSARPADALGAFSDTAKVFQGLAEKRPELHFDLANTQGWVAKAQEALGDFGAALASQQIKAQVLQRVPDASNNRKVQLLVADAHYEQARLQLALGHDALALASAQVATQQRDALLALDPSNLHWLGQSCFARHNLAEIQLALGNPVAAGENLARASADAQRLMGTDATRTNWHVNLQGRLLTLTAMLQMAQRGAVVTAPLQAYLDNVIAIEAAGQRMDTVQDSIVAAAELVLGDALSLAGRSDEAIVHWRAAESRLQGAAAHGHMPEVTLLARVEARLGKLGDARLLAERVRASKYRHPDYAALVHELAHDTGSGQHLVTQRR